MTNDLVKQAREAADSCKLSTEHMWLVSAMADRIEKLEAGLREIAAGYETEWSTSMMGNMFDVAQILSERINIARKALEGKDD